MPDVKDVTGLLALARAEGIRHTLSWIHEDRLYIVYATRADATRAAGETVTRVHAEPATALALALYALECDIYTDG